LTIAAIPSSRKKGVRLSAHNQIDFFEYDESRAMPFDLKPAATGLCLAGRGDGLENRTRMPVIQKRRRRHPVLTARRRVLPMKSAGGRGKPIKRTQTPFPGCCGASRYGVPANIGDKLAHRHKSRIFSFPQNPAMVRRQIPSGHQQDSAFDSLPHPA